MERASKKNKYKLLDQKLYVFNIYDIDTRSYINARERQFLCEQLELLQVPMISGYFKIEVELDELLSFAEDMSVLNQSMEREGLVFKCISDPNTHFKVISNRFLLNSN